MLRNWSFIQKWYLWSEISLIISTTNHFLRPTSSSKTFPSFLPRIHPTTYTYSTPHSQLNWAYGFNIYLLFFFDFTKCHHLFHGSYSLSLSLSFSLLYGKCVQLYCGECVYVYTLHTHVIYILNIFYSYSYIYKHHTLQYFYSSSALEANKPITNTALNTNNCMVYELEITHTIDDDLCVQMRRKFRTLSSSRNKKWKMWNKQYVSDFILLSTR